VAVLGIGPAALIVLAALRARELRRAQAREHLHLHELAERPLFAGPGHVVAGKVELDNGEKIGVRIDIVQAVKNHTSKNSRWHTWSEVSRTVAPGPFYLVREGAPPIYVEPDTNVLVVDTLETDYPMDRPQMRVRTADVKVGEDFLAYGDLHQAPHPRAHDAYRDSIGWVLRPPKRGRMLLATEGIRDRYKDRIRFLQRSALICAAIFCVVHAFATVPFVTAMLFGHETTTTAVRTDTYVTHNKNTTTTHYQLVTRASDGFALTQDVPYATYAQARSAIDQGKTVIVPLHRTGDLVWASYLGQPTVSGPFLIIGIVAIVIAFFVIRSGYRSKYAWYDKKTLDEEGAQGHWVEPRPLAPVAPGTK
jgi:hypothetical protein